MATATRGKRSASAKARSTEAGAAGKKKSGRPRIEIDLLLLGRLAEVGCSVDEIAAMLRRSGLQVDARTIKRRLNEPKYRDAWDEGQHVGKAMLRSRMVALSRNTAAPGPAVQMSIHLSKHWLGMTDKAALELSGRIDSDVQVTSARDRVLRKLDTLAERIQSRVAGIATAAGAGKAPAAANRDGSR